MDMTLEAQKARRNYKRQYRSRNRDKINAQQREWRANNPDKVRKYNEKYWEKKAKNPRYSSWEDYGIDKRRLAELWDAVKSGRYEEMVRSAALAADDKVAEYILLSVMKNLSYDHIEYHEKLGRCPIGRTDFYGVRRLFFHYLDCALKAAGEGASACT